MTLIAMSLNNGMQKTASCQKKIYSLWKHFEVFVSFFTSMTSMLAVNILVP